MSTRLDLGDKPQADIGTLAEPFGRRLDQRKFVHGIDLDRIDPGLDGHFEFPNLFAGAVKDQLAARKTYLQSLPEFAAGIYLEVAAGFFDRTKNAHRRVCFRRIADLQRNADRILGTLEPLDVVFDPSFAEHKDRRAIFTGDRVRGHAADVQFVIINVKKILNFPSFGHNRHRRGRSTHGHVRSTAYFIFSRSALRFRAEIVRAE